MVYNWDGKEAECYRLYVEEKRSLDEVMEYWEQQGFAPSKRAFQTQFKRWEFPSKQNPAHKNPALIARVKELWEKNVMQKDMLETLNSEGFQINDRELMRLRLRFKWLLRDSMGRGAKRKGSNAEVPGSTRKSTNQATRQGRGLIDQLANALLREEGRSGEGESEEERDVREQPEPARSFSNTEHEPPALEPAEALRRQLRQEQLKEQSDEKWRTRKRRRRTRGWAGLPADAPGEPPRFPSETTLDESKAYLGLDNKLYRQVREQFQVICQEHDVVKKTVAGPEKWAQILHQLIHENAHLSSVFHQEPGILEQSGALWRPRNFKALSLDVICMDVTKRLRTMETRLSILGAKNILGFNPEETRQVRTAFYEKLKADHFTSKLAAGDQHWNELKQSWIEESELLTRVIAGGEADPKYTEKLKAIEVLARDVMKRLRNEHCQNDPSKRKQVHQGPGPGPAPPTVAPHVSNAHFRSSQGPTFRNNEQPNSSIAPLSASSDLQIDPSLLLAASDAAVVPQFSHEHPSPHSQAHQNNELNSYASSTPQIFNTAPLPIYFRLHPLSNTTMPSKTVWLSILQTGTISEIKNLAIREHPGTMVVRLEGLIVHKIPGQSDREVVIPVDDKAELNAYLGHVGSSKATFVVLLSLDGIRTQAAAIH